MTTTGSKYDELIRPDRVHGSLYTDPEIFADEMAKIFYSTWVYVGHESEVPEPNDYVVKPFGPQSVILSRAKDGSIHLLQNRCAHRANLVCEAPKGNATERHVCAAYDEKAAPCSKTRRHGSPSGRRSWAWPWTPCAPVSTTRPRCRAISARRQ